MTETTTAQARAARVITELGAPWMINILTSVIAGAALDALAWGVFVATISGVIPMLVILTGVQRGVASDHHVTEIRERHWVIPAILAIVCVGLVVEIVRDAPRELIAWTVSALVVLIGIGIVTVLGKWKVSVHTAVGAGTTVLLAMIASPWFLLALPLTAVIGWSRVWLGDHTRGQVIVGALLGAVLAAVTYLLAS
ncbi:phosphatase PAP2 family protein [Nocardia altamirensis]|uniref:phosphatase PAP2 family protein n=1 Tax=Nocardia altamirensis TaxID=472158 RepID=UPI0008405AF7|nr:phosphatase PAP2 family protein [Nocardia altamirensis]